AFLLPRREPLEEVHDLLLRHLRVGRVLELRLEEDATAGLARVVVEGVLPVPAVDPDQIHLALGALTGESLGIDASSQAFQPGEVVVEEEAVQVRHVQPQPAALSAASQRRLFTFQLGHLDVAAGAIHEKASSPCRGSNAPSSTGGTPESRAGNFLPATGSAAC